MQNANNKYWNSNIYLIQKESKHQKAYAMQFVHAGTGNVLSTVSVPVTWSGPRPEAACRVMHVSSSLWWWQENLSTFCVSSICGPCTFGLWRSAAKLSVPTAHRSLEDLRESPQRAPVAEERNADGIRALGPRDKLSTLQPNKHRLAWSYLTIENYWR